MTILFDLPPKPPLRWASDYRAPTSCYICSGTTNLLPGWPRIHRVSTPPSGEATPLCSEPPPWTTVCRDCVILWREGCGTIEEIQEQRKNHAKTT